MARLRYLVHILHKGEELFLALLLAGMILLAGSQILLRNFFDSGIAWAEPLLRLMVLWVGMLGAMLATHDNKHIRIDIISRYLPPHYRRLSSRLTSSVSALVCTLLAYHSGRLVFFEWQDGTEAFTGMPAWVAELILPIGFSIMALRFALHILRVPQADEDTVQ
jgi:TRAP-type C4-dicarboxylate transport system permease small subunit